MDYLCNSKSEISSVFHAVEGHCLQAMKIVHLHANGRFDWLISEHQSVNPSKEAISILYGKYKRFTFVHPVHGNLTLWSYNARSSVCRKSRENVSPILVTLTSRIDSNFGRSSISFKENKWDGIDRNFNGLDYCVRKNEGKILRFSADCITMLAKHVSISAFCLIP